MVFAMRSDRVAFLVNAAHNGGIGASHFANHEVCRLHTLRSEDVENLVGIVWRRAVIEGENDLLVERQRVGILHAADPGILGGIERAARAERAGVSGTVTIRLCGVVLARLRSRRLSGGRGVATGLGPGSTIGLEPTPNAMPAASQSPRLKPRPIDLTFRRYGGSSGHDDEVGAFAGFVAETLIRYDQRRAGQDHLRNGFA